MEEYHVSVQLEGYVQYRLRAESAEEAEQEARDELENSLMLSELFWSSDLPDDLPACARPLKQGG